MVPENRKRRLLGAYEVVARKRARARDGQPGAAGPAPAEGRLSENAAQDETPLAPLEDAGAIPAIPLPLQAREVDGAGQQPPARTTCKRCAASVAADASECWNCGLWLGSS